MLEILALMALTKKIGQIVEQKGYKSGKYKFLTCVLWFSGELVGAIIGTSMIDTSKLNIYVLALMGAAMGAGIAYFIADNLSSENEQNISDAEKGLDDNIYDVKEYLASTKNYLHLFKINAGGINYYLAISFLIARVLTRLSWQVINSMKYGSSIFPGPLLFGTVFIYDIIITALFLIICYSISRSWLFPILWGFITILGAFTIRLIVQLIESRVLDVSPLLQVNIIINIFLYGFLFATAIIFSVHLMGIKYWSLILGISTANLLSTYFNFLVDKTSPGLEQIGSDIFDGILFGLCIYIGLYFHKQRTRLRAAASPGAPR